MTRPKASSTASISISRPFDARHVSGVNIPGVPPPLANNIPHLPQHQSSFLSTLEPDEIPTHINISAQPHPPRRSNTIAHTLSRPSLRLKTSISRLRGRSTSNSPDSYRKRDRDRDEASEPPPRAVERVTLAPPRLPEIERSINISSFAMPSQNQSKPPPNMDYQNKQHSSRPPRAKRVDSGTGSAIDFRDMPAEERPLGFKEILKVGSFEERMRLYKRAREFWASADHGLGEWVAGRGGVVV